MTSYARYFPWVGLFLATVYLIVVMPQPSDASGAMKLTEAGQIPVNEGGRVKPLDTLARTNLMLISGRQAFTDQQDNPAPPTQWALDVMTSQDRNLRKWSADQPKAGEQDRINVPLAILKSPSAKLHAFEIQDAAVLADFKLEPRTTNLYSYEEMVDGFERFLKNELTKKAVETMKEREALEHELGHDLSAAEMKRFQITELTPEEHARFELFNALRWYIESATSVTPHKVFRIENDQVLSLLGLDMRSGLRYSFDEFVPRLGPLFAEAERARKVENKSRYETHVVEVAKHVRLYLTLANQNTLRLVPPRQSGGEWLPLQVALDAAREPPLDPTDPHAALMKKPRDRGQRDNPVATALDKMLVAYTYYDPEKKPGDPENAQAVQLFNKSLDDYQGLLEHSPVQEAHRAPFETFFNHFAPFYQCTLLYAFVFLLSIGAWIGYREELARTAFWVMLLTLAVHTWAIAARMYLSGRPPVTNLYSSAVFIGWGCVGVAAVLEAIYHNGFATVVGSVLGFTTTIIAHYLAQSGDTLEMMQAVLDTNFWLATHVTAVTLGYTATFVAGFLGMTYIGMGVLTRALDKPTAKSLYQMTYGVVCFATMLSFIGTVLGGIWADQSWGRFWGWDPKENGALLIVIWNAIVLHARWGGMVKERGVAVLVVVGNIVTGWSWFGTNMLGVGLHSYGFMSGALTVLLSFDGLFLGFIAMGLLPLRFWSSFGGTWSLPRFQPPTIPTQPLPALAGVGAPAMASTAVASNEEKPAKNKRGKHGRGVRR
jgi:ABC-type transport system involved in cytochrome c biogenesis permease subunit